MFNGEQGKKSSNRYDNVNAGGTSELRNSVRARVYSGDSFMEQKLTQYQLYWQFYTNRHWGKNNDRLLSFNYCRAIIDKVNKFLAGKTGFEVNIYDIYGKEVPEIVEENMEAVVSYTWLMNKKAILVQEILQMGGICGDAYVFLSPDDARECVKYTLLDSRNTIPYFENGNHEKVIAYKVVQPLYYNDKKYIQKVTEYTKEETKTYYKKETSESADKYDFSSTPHDLGFIPIVHIKNTPNSDAYGGISDIQDIVKLNKIYNELSEDMKAIVDYYAQPTTVITGATVGQLKRGISQIWSGLPADANVFNLSLNDNLGASQDFLKIIKDGIHDMSGVPENVLGKTQHVSNTSAAALQILYLPIIEQADSKWLTYGDGIEQINEMTFVIHKKFFPNHELSANISVDPKYYKRFRATPVFKYGLPSDRTVLLNEITLELTNHIGSRREAMERLGKRNIPLLMQQIEEDDAYKAENEAVSLENQAKANAEAFAQKSGVEPQPTSTKLRKIPQEKLQGEK